MDYGSGIGVDYYDGLVNEEDEDHAASNEADRAMTAAVGVYRNDFSVSDNENELNRGSIL